MQRVELFAIPDLLQRMANARAPARPRTLLQSTPQQAPARASSTSDHGPALPAATRALLQSTLWRRLKRFPLLALAATEAATD